MRSHIAVTGLIGVLFVGISATTGLSNRTEIETFFANWPSKTWWNPEKMLQAPITLWSHQHSSRWACSIFHNAVRAWDSSGSDELPTTKKWLYDRGYLLWEVPDLKDVDVRSLPSTDYDRDGEEIRKTLLAMPPGVVAIFPVSWPHMRGLAICTEQTREGGPVFMGWEMEISFEKWLPRFSIRRRWEMVDREVTLLTTRLRYRSEEAPKGEVPEWRKLGPRHWLTVKWLDQIRDALAMYYLVEGRPARSRDQLRAVLGKESRAWKEPVVVYMLERLLSGARYEVDKED